MIALLTFLIALLSLSLGASIAAIIRLRERVEEYRVLWLAAIIAGDEEGLEEEGEIETN